MGALNPEDVRLENGWLSVFNGTSWVSPMARGLIAWKAGVLTGATISTTPITIYTLAATLEAGRVYKFSWQVRAANSTQWVRIQVSFSPAIPNTAVDVYIYAPAFYGSQEMSGMLFPATTATYTATVAAAGSGTGQVWNDVACRCWYEDIGMAIAATP